MTGKRINLLAILLTLFSFPFSIAHAAKPLDCSNAYASKEVILNPNHKMKTIKIKGVKGANNVVIQCIDQDEPIRKKWVRKGVFDATLTGKSKARIRRERSNKGNGRVYHVDFIATAKDGEQCTGTVQVSVPLNKKTEAVDDGRLFNSYGEAENCNDVTINIPPNITSSPITLTNVGEEYSYLVEATDPDSTSLAYTLISAPDGMSIDEDTGLVRWLPSTEQAGDHNIRLTVSDDQGASSTQSYELVVVVLQNSAPEITSQPVLGGAEGQVYQYQVIASDPENHELNYDLLNGPAGLTVDANSGLVSWVPDYDSAGTHNIELSVTDSESAITHQSFVLTIADTNQLPIPTPQDLTVNEDESLSIVLGGVDPDNDTVVAYVTTWPTLGTLILQGTDITYHPDTNITGTDSFTFKVSDGRSESENATVTIDILPVNDAPIANAISASTNKNEELYLSLEGYDIEGAPLSYSILNMPENGQLSGIAPNLTYTPNTQFSGSDSFTFSVNDGELESNSAVVSIEVLNTNSPPQLSLLSPEQDSTHLNTATIIFEAAALDQEDGDISHSIQWLSDLDGNLGAGGTVAASLSIGNHTITVQATDSQNEIATTAFNLSVIEDTPASTVIIERLSADPNIIIEGESTTIRWLVEGADLVELSPGVGPVSPIGSVEVSPLVDTTYTLTASVGGIYKATSLTIMVRASDAPDLFTIEYPLENSDLESPVYQVIGSYIEPNNQVFVNDAEACNVGNQFVLSNLSFPESEEAVYSIPVALHKPDTSTYSKPVQVNRIAPSHTITLVPDTNCALEPGNIGFELSGIDQPVASIQFDIEGNGTFEGNADDDFRFTYDFETPGVYLVKAQIEYISGDTQDVQVALGVRNGIADSAFYNQRWDEFLSVLSEGDTAKALNFFHDRSRMKYADVLDQLSSSFDNTSAETSALEPIATAASYREFVFLHVLDDQPQVFTITFNGGKIIGM